MSTTSQILGGAGYIAGFAISGGNPLVASAFAAGGSIIGNAIDPVKIDDIVGPRVEDDVELTQTALGLALDLIYGLGPATFKIDWSTGLFETEHRESEDIKGAPEQETRTFTYAITMAGSLAEGPCNLRRIWREGDLIYDLTGTGPIFNTDFLVDADSFNFYPGDFDQLPDPEEQADRGVAETPAYRGIARIVFLNHDVTDLVRVPTLRCELATGTITNTFPKEEITVTESIPPNGGYAFLSDGVTLVFGMTEGILTYVDSPSRTEIKRLALAQQTSLVPGFKGGDFDLSGNYWSGKQENVLAVNGSVVLFDGDTGAVLGKTELVSEVPLNGPISGGPIDLKVIGFAAGAQNVVVLGRKNLFYVCPVKTRVQAGDPVFTVEGFNEIPITRTYDIDALYGGAHTGVALTKDANGDCWVLAEETTPTNTATLIRVEQPQGTIAEAFTGIAISNLTPDSSWLSYEETTHSLIIYSSAQLWRWEIGTQTLFGPLAVTNFNDENLSAGRAGPKDGILWLPEGFAITEIDVVNLVKLQSINTNTWTPDSSFAVGGIYDPVSQAWVSRNDAAGTELQWRYLGRGTGGATTLDVVFDDVSKRVGFPAAEVNTTALAAVPIEFVGTKQLGAARRFLENLARAHFVRVRPWVSGANWGVEFKIRGGASTFTLVDADLGATTGEVVERIKEKIKDPLTLPLAFDVSHLDRDADYETNIEQATRSPEAVDTDRLDDIDYPGVLTVNGARQMAEKALDMAYLEAISGEVAVTYEHVEIDPADAGTITEDGIVRAVEIQSAVLGGDWIYRLEFKTQDDEALTSTAVGQGRSAIVPDQIVISGVPQLFVIDGPLPSRKVAAALGRMFFAAPKSQTAFKGCLIEESEDGETWSTHTFVTKSQAVTHGTLKATLPAGPTTTVDRTNTISVQIAHGSIASVTEDQMLADEDLNAFMVRGDNGWEFGQFATATLQGDGSYQLSILRRGRRNTENRMTGHAAGSPILFPTEASTLFKRFSTEQIDLVNPQERHFRAVATNGQAGLVKTVTVEGNSKKPWSPDGIEGTISADVWTITGSRRSWESLSPSFSSLPLGDDVLDEYEIDVLDAPGGVVKRTITKTATGNGTVVTAAGQGFSATYDDQDQITDFGSVQTQLHLRCYQMSQLVPGFRGEPKIVPLNPSN